jgi:hypothetical protein
MNFNRRDILKVLGLSVLPSPPIDDKTMLMKLFDKANIDFADPSEDGTPNAISIKVDGSTIIGVDGAMAIFKFTKGSLNGVVLWTEKMTNEA